MGENGQPSSQELSSRHPSRSAERIIDKPLSKSDVTTGSCSATVDLIIPARNEADTILDLLNRLPTNILRYIVVVDNASTDATGALARRGGAVLVYQPRAGYGRACLAGLRWIALNDSPPPDAVAFIDADLADDPAALPQLIEPIAAGQVDLALGCRTHHAEPGALTFQQRMGNALACRLIRLATGVRYRDLGPMRVIRWRSLRRLRMRDRTWGWTVEMQFKAARLGLRIGQIDVPYHPRQGGVSKISGNLLTSLRAGVRIVTTIARLWLITPDRRRR